ncbi:hypothetical protein Tco_0546258 [Tanacetum coccineum]
MNSIATQQVSLDNALVAPEKRLKIEKCNAIIEFNKPQREEIYQVTLDDLKLSPCYPAFLITTKVPEICPRLHNQDFVEPPSKEEMVSFTQELGYSVKCISRKSSGLDRIRPSRAQILWGMYNKKNVDFVALLWEDFMFQADNREISFARKENMPYPRFTKVIINHFISKDKTISIRNRINIHTIRNDTLLGTLKFVSNRQDYQMYGALIPDEMINQDIKDSKAYKTYLDFDTGKATPKKARKFKKVASPSKKLSPILEEKHAEKPKRSKKPANKSTTVPKVGVVIRDTPDVSMSKKKAHTKVDRGKGMDLLCEAALLEATQLKKTPLKSKLETHKLYVSDEGTSTKPGVPDVPKYQSESKNKSWGDSDDNSNDDDNDDVTNDDDDDADSDVDGENEASDSKKTDSDEDKNPNLNQNDDEIEEYEEEYVHIPDYYEFTVDDEEYEKLYKDMNKTEVPLQSSSMSSDFANQFLNLDNAPPVDNEYCEDKHKDEDPPAGPDQGLKRRKTSKNVEPSKGSKSKESKSSSSKGTKSQPKSFGKSAQEEESVFETVDTEMPQNQGSDSGNTDDQLNVEATLKSNCKPLSLIEDQGRQVVPVNYFINNELEYLKSGSLSRKYMTSITKTKAAKYNDIQGIEYMVPSVWSPVKWYDYGYLEEIEVRREDRQLYKFREGDFPRLNLRDIEDLLLLLVQNKLSNIERGVIFDLNVALRMFTKRVVILKRVEDLQLSDISNMTPYIAYNNPQGIIYLDKLKRNRLMRSDELYKFCDGTLTSVRSLLHDIASSLMMDYLPKRR